MSIYPRYSLLTLLLLTAVVAGGVMYFRIPHRALISDPPTDHEQVMLNQYGITGLLNRYKSDTVEYEYYNTWQGEKWESVIGRNFINSLYAVEVDGPHKIWFVGVKQDSKEFAPDEEPNSMHSEEIIAWITRCNNSIISTPTNITANPGTKVQLPTVDFDETDSRLEIYFITDRKMIIKPVNLYIYAPINITEIADSNLRARIAEEIAKISDSQ